MAEPARKARAFGRVSSLGCRAGFFLWWRETLARWCSGLWFLCAVTVWKPECLWELAHGYSMNLMLYSCSLWPKYM